MTGPKEVRIEMYTPRLVLLYLVGLSVIVASSSACRESEPAATPTAPAQGSQDSMETPSFRVKVLVGPAITMPTADQFEGATEGELMGLMTSMAHTDQGQPVNRHLQVHVSDKRTGAGVKDPTPAVSIKGGPTGTARELPNVMACLLARHKAFPHFGDNVYLPEGKYTVTVRIGQETAVIDVAS
jgi:hypothetical protein